MWIIMRLTVGWKPNAEDGGTAPNCLPFNLFFVKKEISIICHFSLLLFATEFNPYTFSLLLKSLACLPFGRLSPDPPPVRGVGNKQKKDTSKPKNKK